MSTILTSTTWYQNDISHRMDIDYSSNGLTLENVIILESQYLYQYHKRHRTDIDITGLTLPAHEGFNGDKEWWQNGQLHRIEQNSRGEFLPSIEYDDGDKEWWIFGKKINYADIPHEINKLKCIFTNYTWKKISKLSMKEPFCKWWWDPNNIGGQKAIQNFKD